MSNAHIRINMGGFKKKLHRGGVEGYTVCQNFGNLKTSGLGGPQGIVTDVYATRAEAEAVKKCWSVGHCVYYVAATCGGANDFTMVSRWVASANVWANANAKIIVSGTKSSSGDPGANQGIRIYFEDGTRYDLFAICAGTAGFVEKETVGLVTTVHSFYGGAGTVVAYNAALRAMFADSRGIEWEIEEINTNSFSVVDPTEKVMNACSVVSGTLITVTL